MTQNPCYLPVLSSLTPNLLSLRTEQWSKYLGYEQQALVIDHNFIDVSTFQILKSLCLCGLPSWKRERSVLRIFAPVK